ncbi:MAG: hypothetical protein KBC21_01990 [Candidatus Pacebacteria bacterium]|nr:hypothetical protein [Candidatus Paceibacterota bacterium]
MFNSILKSFNQENPSKVVILFGVVAILAFSFPWSGLFAAENFSIFLKSNKLQLLSVFFTYFFIAATFLIIYFGRKHHKNSVAIQQVQLPVEKKAVEVEKILPFWEREVITRVLVSVFVNLFVVVVFLITFLFEKNFWLLVGLFVIVPASVLVNFGMFFMLFVDTFFFLKAPVISLSKRAAQAHTQLTVLRGITVLPFAASLFLNNILNALAVCIGYVVFLIVDMYFVYTKNIFSRNFLSPILFVISTVVCFFLLLISCIILFKIFQLGFLK